MSRKCLDIKNYVYLVKYGYLKVCEVMVGYIIVWNTKSGDIKVWGSKDSHITSSEVTVG